MKRLLAVLALCASFQTHAQSYIGIEDALPLAPVVVKYIFEASDTDELESKDPVIVRASGSGDTCKEALDSAKRFALEKVNGSWVRSLQKSKNGSYDEEIIQYSGGVISEWKYIKDECTFVIIEAKILKRSNKVQMETADIGRKQITHLEGLKDQFDSRQKAIAKLNDRREALYFQPAKTEMTMIDGGTVGVSVSGFFAFKDIWVSDYKELRQMIGYFNLNTFEFPAKVIIKAVDDEKREIYETSFVWEGQWDLWSKKYMGGSTKIEVFTNRKEKAVVRFRIPYHVMQYTRGFTIEVM